MGLLKKIFTKDNIKKVLLYATIPALIFYSISFKILRINNYDTMEIIRDFAQIVDYSSFLGFLSSIGTWLWVSSAAISFFGFFTLKDINKEQKGLLLILGIFSFLLGFDDFFMIHDWYVDQNICYGLYAILALIILFKYFKFILRINGFAFIFAGFLLASSIFIDLIQDNLPFKYENTQIVEEALKFTGAATWLYFVSLVASFKGSINDNN